MIFALYHIDTARMIRERASKLSSFRLLLPALFIFVQPLNAKPVASSHSQIISINGKKAQTLLALLVSGNEKIASAIENSDTKTVTLHNTVIESIQTYKYEPDNWYYKLPEYTATTKIEMSDEEVNIGEATSLFNFFGSLGVSSDTAMEGSFINIDEIKCQVHVHADISNSLRFQCVLTFPSWTRINPPHRNSP